MTPLLFQAELAEKGLPSKDFSQSTVEIETLALEAGWDPTWDGLYAASRPMIGSNSSPAAAGTGVGGSNLSSASSGTVHQSVTDIDAAIEHLKKLKELKQLQQEVKELVEASGAAPLLWRRRPWLLRCP